MRAGQPTKPLVTKSETATAIFLAVEEDFFPKADRIAFPDIDVDDDSAFGSSVGGNRRRLLWKEISWSRKAAASYPSASLSAMVIFPMFG